ncbi:hypothetical protein J1605_008836 [Eschrichtius robustus]|uniref:Uncharacterized protein n=1 Tax=Eschrichtius robustus TaxID=9764 RepID=A0AB34GX12_ESCRO|nr:hypothetical protein J1605_008836 [Eschrichtius robustus]
MQGTRVRALVREDPTCHGSTKPPQLDFKWPSTIHMAISGADNSEVVSQLLDAHGQRQEESSESAQGRVSRLSSSLVSQALAPKFLLLIQFALHLYLLPPTVPHSKRPIKDPMATDWWRDNFWIILAVAIIFVSVGLSIFLFCVCRHLFRQEFKANSVKPLPARSLSPSWEAETPIQYAAANDTSGELGCCPVKQVS